MVNGEEAIVFTPEHQDVCRVGYVLDPHVWLKVAHDGIVFVFWEAAWGVLRVGILHPTAHHEATAGEQC